MLPSGNDAAVLLAENVAGSVPAFVDEMNAKATELGLTDTHFVNPHGLDDPRALLVGVRPGPPRALRHAGARVREDRRHPGLAPGAALGLRPAQRKLAAPDLPRRRRREDRLDRRRRLDARRFGPRDGRRLFVTVLDSTDRDADATALFDWAFSSYSWVRLVPKTVEQMRLAERLGIGSALVRSLSVCA